MFSCEELNELYREAKEKIEALKLELDLEMQKEKTERDYFRVRATKEKIEKEIGALYNKVKDAVNPIPEFLRGKEGVRTEKLEIGGKTKDQLIQEMKERDINISDFAMGILNSSEFTVSSKPEFINLIHLKVGDLGLPEDKNPTTDEIYKRIKELGLELCPVEVGPNYRLKHADQPIGEMVRIGMKPIAGRDGNPSVFRVGRYEDGLWLYGHWAEPTGTWDPSSKFVFSLCK